MHRSVSAKSFPSPLKARTYSETPTTYQSLSEITTKLHRVTEEFEQVNKEKAVLAAANGQIKRLIAKTISDCQMLKKNHEKLHNESMKLSKATDRLLVERALMEKECQTMQSEMSGLEQVVEKERKEIHRLKSRINEETSASAILSDMCSKSKRELERKSKERDALRASTALIVQELKSRGYRPKPR